MESVASSRDPLRSLPATGGDDHTARGPNGFNRQFRCGDAGPEVTACPDTRSGDVELVLTNPSPARSE